MNTQNLISKRKNKLGSWYDVIGDELNKEYMKELSLRLKNEYKNKIIYPNKEDIFKAFKECPYDKTKIVIIGQDPYHTPNTAHGLVFSSLQKTTPPSLDNIFTEIRRELGEHTFNSNNLTQWANQGMLLLNVALTVRKHSPRSHMNIGWGKFTDRVIKELNNHPNKLIFLLWGNFARQYKSKINTDKHIVLETTHPSPFSAYMGFFDCGHFKKIKEIYPKINFNIY